MSQQPQLSLNMNTSTAPELSMTKNEHLPPTVHGKRDPAAPNLSKQLRFNQQPMTIGNEPLAPTVGVAPNNFRAD